MASKCVLKSVQLNWSKILLLFHVASIYLQEYKMYSVLSNSLSQLNYNIQSLQGDLEPVLQSIALDHAWKINWKKHWPLDSVFTFI